MVSLRGEVTTQIQNSNNQVQNELNAFRTQIVGKADKTTTDTNAKDKYWKFDENGNLVFVELEMDDKLDTNQGTGNAGKYLKVNELGYVETSNMDQVVNSISDIGDDPNVNYYLKDTSSGTTSYALYKVINGNPYKVSGNDSRVDELGQQIIEIGGTVNVIAPMVNSYKLDYDGKELTLTATNAQNNTSEVVSKINIISAETTVNTILNISPITKNPLITTLDSIPDIQFTFTNTYSESSGGAEIEGEVTAIWKVNNVAVRSETIKSKDASGQLITHSFSPAPYITKGMKYSVLVSLTNEFGTQTQYAWTVNAVALSVNLTLNSTTAYSDDVKFKYIPYGTVSKTVYLHRRKAGTGSFTSIKSYSGVTEHGVEMPADSYVTISKGVLTHGVYTIRAYCVTNIDGVNVESKREYVDIIYAEPGQTLVVSGVDESGRPTSWETAYVSGGGSGGGSTTIVQSDWSVNDESSGAYVKNRTHWVEGSMGLQECNPDYDSEEGAFYTAASMSF